MQDIHVVNALRQRPWDTTSSVDVSELATKDEILEIAGLAGWNVKTSPMYAGRKGQIVPGRVVTVRGDTGQPFAPVSPSYKILQNEDAFAFADALVDSGEAKWERAGSLREGAVVFGVMELHHLEVTIKGVDFDDVLKPYMLVSTTHDGTGPYQGGIAYTRPRCTNTYNMARAEAKTHRFTIRHTASLDGRLQMAREALGLAFKNVEAVTALVQRLALARVTDEQVQEIFRTAVWPLSEDAGEVRAENHASTKAFENYLTSETVDGIRGTAWGALSAVTEFIDHETEYKGRGSTDAESVRAMSILWGRGADKEDAALKALTKLAATK